MAKIKINPLDDRIVIEQHSAEEKTAGGIFLPENAKEKALCRGTVVAAGPGKMLDSGNRGKLSVRVGDEVFFAKYSGTEVEVSGTKYTVLKENDILAVIET